MNSLKTSVGLMENFWSYIGDLKGLVEDIRKIHEVLFRAFMEDLRVNEFEIIHNKRSTKKLLRILSVENKLKNRL